MIEEYDGTDPSRKYVGDDFDNIMEPWARWFTRTAVPGINTSIQELAALSVAQVYAPGNTYDVGEVVIGDDGRRYPCINGPVQGVEPTTDTANTYFGEPYGVSLSEFYGAFSGKNRIINGDFRINQDAVSGTVSLAADEYGHDMFKGGAGGAEYTFVEIGNEVEITISSGSLVQTIHGSFLRTGIYVASWDGSAQVKIGTGSYGDSGISGAVVGGTEIDIEIGPGTIKNLQFEEGTKVSKFESRLNELDLCRLFYRRVEFSAQTYVGVGNMSNPTATIPRGSHLIFGDLSGMIGEPVISRHTGGGIWSVMRGQTIHSLSTITLGKISFSASMPATGSQFDALILVALAGAWAAASTRL